MFQSVYFVSLSVISILKDPAEAKVFDGVYEYFNCAVLS